MQPLNLIPPAARKRRGNPQWGKAPAVVGPATLTEWDLLLEDLGFNATRAEARPDLVARYPQVRRFVRRFAKTRYIPEAVLTACGVAVAAEGVGE